MSKLDAQRAMREANWAARQKDAPTRAPAPKQAPAEKAPVAVPGPGPEATELCGHRAISGKTCTSTLGHSEQSHRYK
jgi:hypothetical protein